MTFNLSSREAQERKDTLDSPDPVVPNNPTSEAWTAAHAFSNTSVRQRTEAAAALKAEVEKPKSHADAVADYWYAKALATRAREEQKKRAEQQLVIDRANKERADKERSRKLGQLKFRQNLLDGMFLTENATPAEIAAVNADVAENNPTSFGDHEIHQAALWKLRAGG